MVLRCQPQLHQRLSSPRSTRSENWRRLNPGLLRCPARHATDPACASICRCFRCGRAAPFELLLDMAVGADNSAPARADRLDASLVARRNQCGCRIPHHCINDILISVSYQLVLVSSDRGYVYCFQGYRVVSISTIRSISMYLIMPDNALSRAQHCVLLQLTSYSMG